MRLLLLLLYDSRPRPNCWTLGSRGPIWLLL
jgi:hypothetical protein